MRREVVLEFVKPATEIASPRSSSASATNRLEIIPRGLTSTHGPHSDSPRPHHADGPADGLPRHSGGQAAPSPGEGAGDEAKLKR